MSLCSVLIMPFKRGAVPPIFFVCVCVGRGGCRIVSTANLQAIFIVATGIENIVAMVIVLDNVSMAVACEIRTDS